MAEMSKCGNAQTEQLTFKVLQRKTKKSQGDR